ncbi:putative receptor protein kinase ZmPK1 [Jatropha curcas]|uniref:putative receptor protein kinase ZmPK1 n=1 Tax=Jatropha curcas TaxID=180498 RepID=UPI001894EC5D|nr:putative receptor protein kinase ZmPK1 [Jatropha curcas]
MDILFFLIVLLLVISPFISLSASDYALRWGSHLSVDNSEDVLISPNGVFSAGFYPVGDNAYSFAIWFSKPTRHNNYTVVWMANRDFPVNGKRSKLLLLETGNLILTDAGQSTAWSSDTSSQSPTMLRLNDTGNLLLQNMEGVVIWQSFDSPTDTLLPFQRITRYRPLVSSRSSTNFSTGFYKLVFNENNILRLVYDGPEISSTYWPYQWLTEGEVRFQYNSNRIASFDSLGEFTSSDNWHFVSADYGVKLQRRLTLDYDGNFGLKVSKSNLFLDNHTAVSGLGLNCSNELGAPLHRAYQKSSESETLKFVRSFTFGLGGIEIVVILVVWCFLIKSKKDSDEAIQSYHPAETGFKRFTYSELKKATGNFNKEIGRGAGGIVYKGVLSDSRVAAIKLLNVAKQGEAEFLAEVSTIGKLNHMNLIEIWGYCAQGKHRLLVYEYMEHGSLAENLSAKALDWQKRFEIALGTARGLAYLHEECLEWVLHCDVKPQNILLDSNYQPKVSDFGLSKLLSRGKHESFSKIRGTRGYMAPEWVSNLPITSKVDVYSYGIVVLEMITGKNPATLASHSTETCGEIEHKRLVTIVRDKKIKVNGMASWIEEIVDPTLERKYDQEKIETLVTLALQCVEEDRDARPTISKVVEMLLHLENH